MIVIYLCVCSIYDDDDDDEATRESPETRGRGLCSYLGFESHRKRGDPNERKQQKNDSKRESAERERDRRRRRRIKRE